MTYTSRSTRSGVIQSLVPSKLKGTMTPDEVELMKVLCQQIATEKDNNRLSQLISELNELLERTNRRLDSPPNTDPRP
jgi:hypothetical protein